MRMNRRGDLSVVILVFLVLTTSIIALFLFSTNNGKIETTISDVQLVDDFYERSSEVDFYLDQIFREVFVLSYIQMAKDGDYAFPKSYVSGTLEFDAFNSGWRDLFLEKLKSNFVVEANRYSFKEDYLIRMTDTIKREDFEITREEGFVLRMNGWGDAVVLEKLSLNYKPRFEVGLDFEEFGLVEFDEFFEAKEICGALADLVLIENCFVERLDEFEAEAGLKKDNLDKEYVVVKLLSKRDFLLNGEFRKIELEFIPL